MNTITAIIKVRWLQFRNWRQEQRVNRIIRELEKTMAPLDSEDREEVRRYLETIRGGNL